MMFGKNGAAEPSDKPKLSSKLSLSDFPNTEPQSAQPHLSEDIEAEPKLSYVCCCPYNKSVKDGCKHATTTNQKSEIQDKHKWKRVMLKVQSRMRDDQNRMCYRVQAQNLTTGEKKALIIETQVIDGPDLIAIEKELRKVVDLAQADVQILIVISDKMLAKKAAKSAKELLKQAN